MSDSSRGPADYVKRVRQDTRHYIEELLRDNEKARLAVSALEKERARLESELEMARAELDRIREKSQSLVQQANDAAGENNEIFEKYLAVEQQNDNLANLYVSAYRLHGTLDPQEVLRAIQEIVVNLVGSEEFAVLERTPDGQALSMIAGVGVDAARFARVPIGEGCIGQVASSGERFVVGDDRTSNDADPDAALTACVPLIIDGEVMGVIAIFSLLGQKPGLEPIDFEIFDLLANQAATALHAARLHALSRLHRAAG